MWRGCCATRRQIPSALPAKAGLAEAFCRVVVTPKLHEAMGEQRPVHVPRASTRLPELINSDDVVIAFVQGGKSGATSAHKRGEPYMRDNAFLAYLDQASLCLAEAEHYFRPLLEICQQLAATFDYVTSRLVLDPPACHGPPLVADSDILVLQLRGTQRLTLRRPTSAQGVSAMRPAALMAAELQPGDALYVPGGVECQASGGQIPEDRAQVPQAGPCLYALLSLRTTEQSLDVSLGMYLNDALRDGRLSLDTDAFFRSAVTRHTVPCRYLKEVETEELASKGKELEARMGRCVAELASKITAAELRQHFGARMEKLRKAQLRAAQQTLAADGAGPQSPPDVLRSHSAVLITTGVTCRCTAGSETAHFKRGSETLSLPIARSASHLISKLCDGNPHVIDSLPCDDPFERLCVCQVLVHKSCLEAAGPRARGPGAEAEG